jgi:dTDP-4-dehydrorhamnose reductase
MLVVTGGTGFLGSNVVATAKADGRAVIAVGHSNVSSHHDLHTVAADLTKPGSAHELIHELQPEMLINCAALANVDESEASPEKARLLNVTLPRELAIACRDAGIPFTHVSTDSVFDGRRGRYRESDTPNPVNEYSRSKLEGEQAVLEAMPHALVVRTNFIGLSSVPGLGLGDWIAGRLEARERIRGFTDVIISPLEAGTLSELLIRMTERELSGLYHLGSSDEVSKFDLALRIAAALDLDASLVEPATVGEGGLGAPRPLRISLDSSRAAAALGQPLPTVQDTVNSFANSRRSRNVRLTTSALKNEVSQKNQVN